MMRRWLPDLHSLSAQMILSFIALVLLTAVAAGLPAVWLIGSQLDRQAWAQVEQGGRASAALYVARENELAALATLTAERPTLRRLLAEGDLDALETYLQTLRVGAGLDLVLVCDPDSRPTTQSGELAAGDLCADGGASGFHLLSPGEHPLVGLFASHSLVDEMGTSLGSVLVGFALDDGFALEMREQTGLEHTIVARGETAATTLPVRRAAPCSEVDGSQQVSFPLNGESYHATCLPLNSLDLWAEVALETTVIATAQRHLVSVLGATVLGVVVVASLLGIVLARRIARPLAHLAGAADRLSQGELASPFVVSSRVREVALLAGALEGARSDLYATLHELSREKDWTDHLLAAIVEGIVTLDRHRRITFFSHGAERITGWKREEVLGRGCDEVFKTLQTDLPFSKIGSQPGRREKISVELRDGREAILAVTSAPLLAPDGGDAQVALVFRDVSEAEAMHRLLGHFLASVAHEFRTPLSALAASVELLLDQAPDLSTEELAELLNSVHLGVLGLQTLIDNLLESASIEAGRFRVYPRAANVSEIIAEGVRVMQPLLDRHGQQLIVELPATLPVVRADARRAVQVLVNLLSNASKYGPDDAEIEVGACVRGDWVRVSVSDAGPGVPQEGREDLFRRFVYPASDNDKAQVGAGLGLSVVKAIVEAHGGEVGVDDRPGGGSSFWFTLPMVSES